jgi:glycosyltransferase involved in cell wall biosynthesis
MSGTPHVSIVIPVYNEEGILRGSVLELEEKLRPFGWSYELLLCENGSRDRTIEIGRELEVEHPQVRMLSVGQPNYGLAMKMGILEARGTYVICDEIDLLDTEFYARAMALLETARRCVLDRDVFASEFVIRAHREGKKVVEIPFAVREKRPPSINLLKRVPHVVKSVAKLAISVRRS